MPGKSKRLFVSASSKEAKLSAALVTHLGNAFEETLEFASSAQDLGAGHEWKAWIRQGLSDCDGGIFLMTPTYAKSPWPIAEFTAFWLQGKPIYVLLAGAIKPSDLFRPMQDDHQATHLADIDHLKSFFRNLATFANKERIPFSHVEVLSFSCLKAYEECRLEERDPEDVEPDPKDLAPGDSTYPRRHDLFRITWALARNSDSNTLRAVCTREEAFVCQNGVHDFIPVIVAQAANIVPFDGDLGFEVQLLDYEYPAGKVSIEHVRHATGQNYSFRLRFTPPLRQGAAVSIRYRFTIPRMKVATYEQMREYLFKADSHVELRSYESFIIQVLDPTSKFIYETIFDANCQIQPMQPDVSWRQSPFPREQAELMEGGYSCIETPDGGWRMRIERQNPTVETRYSLRWKLPLERDLDPI